MKALSDCQNSSAGRHWMCALPIRDPPKELDTLERVFSLLHPVNAGSDMFRDFLRAPSPQATQA